MSGGCPPRWVLILTGVGMGVGAPAHAAFAPEACAWQELTAIT